MAASISMTTPVAGIIHAASVIPPAAIVAAASIIAAAMISPVIAPSAVVTVIAAIIAGTIVVSRPVVVGWAVIASIIIWTGNHSGRHCRCGAHYACRSYKGKCERIEITAVLRLCSGSSEENEQNENAAQRDESSGFHWISSYIGTSAIL